MVFLHHAFPHQPEFWTKLGVPSVLATVLSGIGASGAFGVSLFFVLSAYLITELLLREKELVGSLDVKSFYVRRILRIWPLYFFFLALAAAMHWFVPGQNMGWRAGLAFSALAGNWYIVFVGFPVIGDLSAVERFHRGAVLPHVAADRAPRLADDHGGDCCRVAGGRDRHALLPRRASSLGERGLVQHAGAA